MTNHVSNIVKQEHHSPYPPVEGFVQEWFTFIVVLVKTQHHCSVMELDYSMYILSFRWETTEFYSCVISLERLLCVAMLLYLAYTVLFI